MKERHMPNGYMRACLRIIKAYKYIYIHRLVYETFIGPIPSGMEVNHKDGCKTNNNFWNLELMTRKENAVHSWETGLAYPHNPHRRKNLEDKLSKEYPPDVIHSICHELESTILTYQEISEKVKVPVWIVNRIANGILWRDISKGYNFVDRLSRRHAYFVERDEEILRLRSSGYKIREIAEKLGSTFDAIARRLALMKRTKLEGSTTIRMVP